MVGQERTSIGSMSRGCWEFCEDIKTVAPLIKSKDDLVTVDHLPGSKY